MKRTKRKYLSSFFCNINGVCLDKNQINVVTSKRKNILVLAGAGCGKTLMIVARVRYLINYLGANPKDILCISFTNDAVSKLKKDLNIKDVDIMTFHKLALKIVGNKKEILTDDMLKDIIINAFSKETLYGLYNMSKEEMCTLIETFINLFKSQNYSLDKFYEFIKKANSKDKILLQEIMKCYICYETYLNKEDIIDFNDMINIAIKRIDYVNVRYKYVIIDEYQDTSMAKLELVKKIMKLSNANLFAVGDDFQSIYRFTGSNIKVITNFKRLFSFSKIYKLKNTYRVPDELIKIAGKFIMKNPVQLRKRLRSKNKLNNSIQVVYYNDLNKTMNQIIKEDEIDDVLILSRNNIDLSNVKINDINYKKLTIHKSKGLESNYVFIIGLNNNKNGFPNKIKDHPILKYVNNYKEYYTYEEERRLFYVALTRCLKKVYLFTNKNNESIFVKEIKRYKSVTIREK